MKKFLFALLFGTGLTKLVGWLNREKVAIICYHSITPDRQRKKNDPHKLQLPVTSFIEQLQYLKTHYTIISLSDYVQARLDNRKLPHYTAVLTFDDGARNFLTVAAPLLRERGLSATSFVVTGNNYTREQSGAGEEWTPDDDDTYLGWSDIRKLAEQGFDFGSHTCSHTALIARPQEDALNELQQSVCELRSHLGAQNFSLSYPHGQTSPFISHLSSSVGYACAVTTELGLNDDESDLFALKRIVVASDDDLYTFVARLSGLTKWYDRARKLTGTRTDKEWQLTVTGGDTLEEFPTETQRPSLVQR